MSLATSIQFRCSNKSKLVFNVIFVVLSLQLLLVMKSCQQQQQGGYISQNFADVISVATQRYVHSRNWTSYMEQLGFVFSGDETCNTRTEFPTTFNFTRNSLNLCYENTADATRMIFNNLAAKLLVETIRNQYNVTHTTLNGTMIPLDVSKGVFESMRDGVNSGTCDVAIGAVNWGDDRKPQVTFLCPYAASAPGILRGEKDNSTITITNEKDMDQSGVIVAVVVKSTYETWAKANLKLATIASYLSFEIAWQMTLNQTVHTFLYNSNAMYSRLKDVKAAGNCASCYVKVYGTTTPFSSLISNQIYKMSNAMRSIQISFVWSAVACVLLSILLTIL